MRFPKIADTLVRDGKTALCAAIDEQAVAVIAVEAPAKPSTPAAIAALHALGLETAMITGDSLAAADIGLAIGTGTDVAIGAAPLEVVSGELTGVAAAIHLSGLTMRNIRQTLGLAFGCNVELIPVAVGSLYPPTGCLLSSTLAAFAMAMSSTFVLSNAIRLRFVSIPRKTIV